MSEVQEGTKTGQAGSNDGHALRGRSEGPRRGQPGERGQAARLSPQPGDNLHSSCCEHTKKSLPVLVFIIYLFVKRSSFFSTITSN